jgi:hypothetical protein
MAQRKITLIWRCFIILLNTYYNTVSKWLNANLSTHNGGSGVWTPFGIYEWKKGQEEQHFWILLDIAIKMLINLENLPIEKMYVLKKSFK